MISTPSGILLNIIKEVCNRHEKPTQISVDTLLLLTRKNNEDILPLLTELSDHGYITIHASAKVGKTRKLTDTGKISLNQ